MVGGPVQIRFDLINFFAMFCMEFAVSCKSYSNDIRGPCPEAVRQYPLTSGFKGSSIAKARFDLINFFAMFCMECGTKLRVLQPDVITPLRRRLE